MSDRILVTTTFNSGQHRAVRAQQTIRAVTNMDVDTHHFPGELAGLLYANTLLRSRLEFLDRLRAKRTRGLVIMHALPEDELHLRGHELELQHATGLESAQILGAVAMTPPVPVFAHDVSRVGEGQLPPVLEKGYAQMLGLGAINLAGDFANLRGKV